MSQPIEVELSDMAHGGEAVGRVDGKAVFVAGALPGERVHVAVEKDGGSWARARLIDVIEPGADRTQPRCPHFGTCGGCQWQFVDYEAQLQWKRRIVHGQLIHLGRLDDVDVRATVPSQPYRYRNRMDFHISEGRPSLYRARSRVRVPLEVCHLLVEPLHALFCRLGPLDGVESITLRASVATGDQMVVVRGAVPAQAPDWGASVVRVRRGKPAALFGRPHLTELVAGGEYRITANAFFQNNTDGAAELVKLVREALQPDPGDVLLDGYAGGGLFSVSLTGAVDEVIAVETSPLGLTDLEHNLEAAGAFASIVPVPFEEAGPEVGECDLVVVDPPRDGLGAAGAEMVIGVGARTVALVSCDPASLARDARALIDGGYDLDWVAPVDMFPQTYHVETVSRFVAR